jgi:molybdopterin converting factor small subunit
VRYFASLVDLTGCAVEELEIDPQVRISGLWSTVLERHPRLAALEFRPLAACDLVYADWERELSGVREVAFLPPVSGG